MGNLKEVDWSKAPEGATHYNAECENPWLKETPASYFKGDGWIEYHHPSNKYAVNHLKNAVKRHQEWDGSGLPPIGTVCEFKKDEWVSGEVFGHRLCSNGDVEAFVNLKNSWDYSSELGRFRPIKTPEQIAAEERLHAIDEMMDFLGCYSTTRDAMGVLYDAGYRRTGVGK